MHEAISLFENAESSLAGLEIPQEILDAWHEARGAFEEALRRAGELEDCDELAARPGFPVVDTRSSGDYGRIKWKNPRRHTAKKECLGFHHVAAGKGSTSPRKSAVHRYRTALEAHKDISEVWIHPNGTELTIEHKAWLQALAKRYRGEANTPDDPWDDGYSYHALIRPEGLFLVRPFDWITYHGHTLNRTALGVAWDANSLFTSPEPILVDQVVRLVEFARDEEHPAKTFRTHSQCSDKLADPGVDFVMGVMFPAAQRTHSVIDLDWKARNGRSLAVQLKAKGIDPSEIREWNAHVEATDAA